MIKEEQDEREFEEFKALHRERYRLIPDWALKQIWLASRRLLRESQSLIHQVLLFNTTEQQVQILPSGHQKGGEMDEKMTLEEIEVWWNDRPRVDKLLKRPIFGYWEDVTDWLIQRVKELEGGIQEYLEMGDDEILYKLILKQGPLCP